MKVNSVFIVVALLCASLTPVASAQNAAEPACDGAYNIFRVSEVKPGSTMNQLMAAVDAHQAWYKSHGYSDVIFAARILVRDPNTHAQSYSDTQIATYHYTKSQVPMSAHDAAWDAYVKLYSDCSNIKETITQCVPAFALPAALNAGKTPAAPTNLNATVN